MPLATAKIICYLQNESKKKPGYFPICLQIVYQGVPRRITLPYKCKRTEWDFDKSCFKKSFEGYRTANKVLRNKLDLSESIIEGYEKKALPYVHKKFREDFLGKKTKIVANSRKTVKSFALEITQEFLELGKMGQYDVYNNMYNRLNAFSNLEYIYFEEIDFSFLKKWEIFLFNQGAKAGGIHVYMRTFRALYNQAIDRGLVEEKHYPFATPRNRRGYSLKHLKTKSTPRAMTYEEIEAFKSFDYLKYPKLLKGYICWMFSYYARGINFADIAELKKIDVQGERFIYRRSKNGQPFNIQIGSALREIINLLKDDSDNPYLFYFIYSDFHQTAKQKYYRKKRVLKTINQQIREIAVIQKIDNPNFKMTTYVARHSYANRLRAAGVAIDKISQAMGHQDTGTTKIYLNKFNTKDIDDTDDVL